jgi:hypothetical protein
LLSIPSFDQGDASAVFGPELLDFGGDDSWGHFAVAGGHEEVQVKLVAKVIFTVERTRNATL